MTVDLDSADWVLGGLRQFPVAITTVCEGRTNGLISLSGTGASVLTEAPRISISLTKYNLTHGLVEASGVFAFHLLAAEPAAILERSLEIIRRLGGHSGRDMDKLEGLAATAGVTGSPILADALGYVEGNVIGRLETEENTIFVADVVAAGRLREGPRLRIGRAWSLLGKEWTDYYQQRHLLEIADCQRRRGLAG